MTRPKRVLGEKPLFWTGSSKHDLLGFPEAVIDQIGTALSVAQFGGKHPSAKPWRGEGPGVFEMVENHRTDTYRAVYTVNLRVPSTCFMRFKRSRRPELRPHGEMSS